MPTYTFRNKQTGVVEEHVLKMAEKAPFLTEHPHLESIITYTNPVCDPFTIGVSHIDNGMRDVLTRIKKANRRSTINV